MITTFSIDKYLIIILKNTESFLLAGGENSKQTVTMVVYYGICHSNKVSFLQ